MLLYLHLNLLGLNILTKVTQILYSGLGGHASVTFSILRADTYLNWESSLIFIGIERMAPAYKQQALELGIPFVSIQSRQKQPWRSWLMLYYALVRLSPEIVILHSISSLIPVALYSLIYGAKVISVEHTPFNLRSSLEKAISALASVLSKRVVVLTDAYREAYLSDAFFFQRASKLALIPNGVDVTRFSMDANRCSDFGGRIGMAARFTANKRQDLLILTVVHLYQRFPKVPWKISLAGDGDTLEPLRRLASINGLADKVEFVGNLTEDELICWFRTLDLYAHASEGETLSTSMLQAMSMGLPIVASKVQGIEDLLNSDDGNLGIMVQRNTSEAFADEIASLYFAKEKRASLSELSRAVVKNKYSHVAMFQAYNFIVQESLN